MLGHKLTQCWQKKYNVWTTVRGDFNSYKKIGFYDQSNTIEHLDIENIISVEKAFQKVRPTVVINAIGIIKQLPTAKNVIQTLRVNSIFPHQLAELAHKYDARLITISTDCVFDGVKGAYTEEDLPNAQDLYGKSKNLGEITGENCLTLRTSIIGRELNTEHSLVEWFLSNEGKSVKGFVNAVYTGFPTIVIADILADLIKNHTSLEGLYHVSSEPINKFELLKLVRDAYRAKIKIEPFEDFRIDRSLNSDKFRRETGFAPLEWRTMIERMAADNDIYKNYQR